MTHSKIITKLETLDYNKYIQENPFNEVLNEEIDLSKPLNQKFIRPVFEAVDPTNKTPISTEYDDLIRLHYLITHRRVSTILEFGVGKSTAVFNHALEINRSNHFEFMQKNLRRSDLFKCYSIDNNQEWIDLTSKNYPNLDNINYFHSDVETSTFNGRVCTLYENLPNICPDFIYLDAPDQYSSKGDVRGISTRHPDRFPMSADILTIENFLLPGTLIVVDGRTANAIFIKNNLQRDWEYNYSEKFDQHFFELIEKPLGPYNKKQLEYCLEDEWNS